MKRILLALTLLALLLAAGLFSQSAQGARSKLVKISPVESLAYGFLVNRNGRWIGPTESGEADQTIIESIIQASPSHLRVAMASNSCPLDDVWWERGCYTTVPSERSTRRAFKQLTEAGIKLGTAINIHPGRRSYQESLHHACQIKTADQEQFYDWIFLDFADDHPNLQKIVDDIRSGVGCGAGGWQRVMTNASGFTSGSLARNVWVHAKRFSLMNYQGKELIKQVGRAIRGERGFLTSQDRRFINEVKARYPRAWPVLKLEVPKQTGDKFANLPSHMQKALLQNWSKKQSAFGYKMIYPLWIHQGYAKNSYDSRLEDTFSLQLGLINNLLPS